MKGFDIKVDNLKFFVEFMTGGYVKLTGEGYVLIFCKTEKCKTEKGVKKIFSMKDGVWGSLGINVWVPNHIFKAACKAAAIAFKRAGL